jgi:selenocysteine lyase/cysteine desulfurase
MTASLAATDWTGEFPGLAGRTYLNNAAESLGSRTMAAALQRYAADKQRGAPGRDAMYAAEAGCRQGLAALLGCQADEIALLGSTSEAISTVLFGVDWHPGDNVVVTDLEFPAAVIACLEIGQRHGVDVRVVHHRGGAISPDALAAQVDERTRIVALSHVSFRSGYRADLEAVAAVAHARGARLLVDAAQSLGAVHFDAGSVDFVAGCSFKWLLGTHGTGFLYCRRDRLEEIRVPRIGWRSVQDYFGVVESLAFELQADARRFETGMLSYPSIYALDASLRLLREIGMEQVEQRVLALTGRVLAGLRDRGITALTPDAPERRAGIVAFETPRFAEIGRELEARGVFAWCKEGRVRVSAHFYNRESDVDAFLEGLRAVLGAKG